MSAVLHRTRSTDAIIAREEVLHNGQVEFAKFCSLQEGKGIREPYNHGAAQMFIQKFSEWEEEFKTKEAERIRVKKELIESIEEPSTKSKPPCRVSVKKELIEEQQGPTQEAPVLRRSSRLAKIKKENPQEEFSANLSEKPRCSRKRRSKPTAIKKEPLENEIVYDEIPVYQRPTGIGWDQRPCSEDLEEVAALNELQQVETIDRQVSTLNESPGIVIASRSTSVEADSLQRPAEEAFLMTKAHGLSEPGSRIGSYDHVDQEYSFARFISQCGFGAHKSDLRILGDTTLPRELVSKCFDDEWATTELDWNANIASRVVAPEATEVQELDYDSGIASGKTTPVQCALTASLLPRQPGKLITDLDGWQPASQIERDIGIDINKDTQLVTAPIKERPDSAIDVEEPGNCSTTAHPASTETAAAKSGLILNQERLQQIQAKARETKQRLESDAMSTGSERKKQRSGPVHIHGQSQDSSEMRRDTGLAASTRSAPTSEYASENPEKSMDGVDITHLSCLLRVLPLQGELQPTQSPRPDSHICSEHGLALQPLDQVAYNDSCENEAKAASHISRPHGSIKKKCETRKHRLRSLHTELCIDGRCFVSFDEAFAFCTSRRKENTRRRKRKRARRLAELREQQGS